LQGYALVWNQKSTDRGGFKVSLAPNSATFKTPTFALFNHNYDMPLARTDNNSLSITSDNYGAKVSMELPNTTHGRDVAEMVRTGLVKGMSFGMLMDGAKFTSGRDKDGDDVDTYTAFDCDEVTITPIPAFTATSIGVAGPAPEKHAAEPEKKIFADSQEELQTALRKQEEYRHAFYAIDRPE
jgi:HK97 family phage prohead protease